MHIINAMTTAFGDLQHVVMHVVMRSMIVIPTPPAALLYCCRYDDFVWTKCMWWLPQGVLCM